MKSNQLLAVEEVADILQVRVHRVYDMARQGIIPAVRLGRQLRFSPAKIQEFIDAGGQALPGGWRREA